MDTELRELERSLQNYEDEALVEQYVLTRRRKEPNKPNPTKFQVPFTQEQAATYFQIASQNWAFKLIAESGMSTTNFIGIDPTDTSMKPVRLRDNYFFIDALKFHDFERGRSAAHAIFKSIVDKDKIYQMFLSDLGKAMVDIKSGCLVGMFTFVKRGANFAVRHAGK